MTWKDASTSAHESTDKRVRRSKNAVLAETYTLLSEAGLGGVSIDEVSRRSGVSKTTIYRHWPSRVALLLEACSKIGAGPEIPDTGSLERDLTELTAYLAHELQNARWPAVLPSIIDAAERDPDLAELHAKLHAGLMTPFLTVVERAKKRGKLAPDEDTSEIVAAIVGPFFYRRWFSKEALDDRFAKSVVGGIVGRTKPR